MDEFLVPVGGSGSEKMITSQPTNSGATEAVDLGTENSDTECRSSTNMAVADEADKAVAMESNSSMSIVAVVANLDVANLDGDGNPRVEEASMGNTMDGAAPTKDGWVDFSFYYAK